MGLVRAPSAARAIILDGTTVRAFATDTEALNAAVDPQFHALDVNGDGVLSRAELRPAFERLNLLDLHFGVPVSMTPAELTALYDSVFEDFDTDRNNTVCLPEFRSSLQQILLAIADGLGSAPITMLLEEGSLLGTALITMIVSTLLLPAPLMPMIMCTS